MSVAPLPLTTILKLATAAIGTSMFVMKNLVIQLINKLKDRLSWKKKEIEDLEKTEDKLNLPKHKEEYEMVEESLNSLFKLI